MDRLLAVARVAAAPLLERLGWTLAPLVGGGRVRLRVARAGDGASLLDVVLEPRLRVREGGCYAQTERFYLYYEQPHGVPPISLDQADVDALMQALEGAVRTEEPLLDDAALGRCLVSGGPASPHERPRDDHDRSLSVLEFGGPEARQHILRVTFACNQRCPFCFVSRGARRPSLEDVERALSFLRQESRADAEIAISGGEPTLDRRLGEILALCHANGFDTIQLQTNAVHLADPKVAAVVRGAGARLFFVSFHSHREALYDRITRSRGDFARAVAGIRTLLSWTDASVTLNLIVMRRNVATLAPYVTFVHRLRPPGRPLALFFSMLSGLGHRLAPDCGVSLDEVRPHLQRAVARAEALGVEVRKFAGDCALPLCVLGRPDRYAETEPQRAEDVAYTDQPAAEGGGRVKRTACRGCRLDDRCAGVSVEYAKLFGLGALRPVRRPAPRRRAEGGS